jgi:serine/threonine protein kinase
MGVVYRALDLTLGRDVAVKTLPHLSDDAAERLLAEARAMASLSHEDVAVLYEVARWRGTPLLVMEYLAGGTLATRLRESRLADAELVALIRLLARRLARVHARGLYHGDIKPSNVGFAADRVPRLLDFGLARALTGRAPSAAEAALPPAQVGGTWAYLSPEVRDGAAPGPTLDLWALGVVLCEALTGEHPFPHARTRQALIASHAAALARVQSRRSGTHHRVLARVLAIDPALRPATAAELDDLLASL